MNPFIKYIIKSYYILPIILSYILIMLIWFIDNNIVLFDSPIFTLIVKIFGAIQMGSVFIYVINATNNEINKEINDKIKND